MSYIVTAGRSYPLGATLDSTGINFALFSANAEKVELCIFDATGTKELQRISLPEFTDEVWHGHIKGLTAGTLYGYRVHGPFAPHKGHRFNAHKLLLDPYAKQLHGKYIHSDSHYAYDKQCPQKDLTLDIRDNAKYLPKCVVTETLPSSDSQPQIHRRNTIIYEVHVKGFTQLRSDVPIALRGTYAGLAEDSVCQYLQDLGITSIELLPVHTFLDESFALKKGLCNYWGYNSLAFFVPDSRYSHSGELSEFKALVEKLHQYDIEVILDVVYNHTAEGNELGPTICYRGIDNASYYRLQDENKRYYNNYSGCGNTLNIQHPRVLQLVTDSLRYWVETMGIDGFRFDLAPILGRTEPHFSTKSHFFSAIQQDPILAKVKLIAEPWDIGEGGYQLGQFPNNWLEWNDRFRDTCRRFWRGDEGMAPEFARRLHGSSDLFEKPSRRPSASVNFITSHDGFTLHDLVSYQGQQNHANGEQNQDGHHSNFSYNCGVDGETDNKNINLLRQRQKRNLLTTLLISQGTPMLLAGDELNNSQHGNNNAYCQDNEVSWLHWQETEQTIAFVKQLISLRKAHPLLNSQYYQHGKSFSKKTSLPDVSWLNCHGKLMQEGDWHDRSIKCFAMLLAETEHRANQDHQNDDALLLIFNAHQYDINYLLPELNGTWQILIDTAKLDEDYHTQAPPIAAETQIISNSAITVIAHSCVVMRFSQNDLANKPLTTEQTEPAKENLS